MVRDLYVGIDPGAKGAIVIVKGSHIIDWMSFQSHAIKWECDVNLLDEQPVRAFLDPYADRLETITIECPKANTFGGKTSINSVSTLRGYVGQLMSISGSYDVVRRLVDPQAWQRHHGFKKTTDRKVKDIVQEQFLGIYPDLCKFKYELEGAMDGYYVAQWGQAQNILLQSLLSVNYI